MFIKKRKISLAITLIVLMIGNKAMAQSSDSALPNGYKSPITKPIANPTSTATPVKISQGNSCDLPWGGTITSGNSVVAYSSTVSSNCTGNSQSRTCFDGTLSGSYTNSSCQSPPPPPPPPVVQQTVVQQTPWYQTNARGFVFSNTGYYSPGVITVNSNGTFSGNYKEGYCIYKGETLPWDGASSCLYQGSWYPNTTTGATFVYSEYGMSGNVSTTGSGSGAWYKVGGGASGVIYFSPSNGGIAGQFSNYSGASISYTAY